MNINGEDINIIFIDDDIPGCVHHNSDDSYTIFISAKLCYEMQLNVCKHELGHILNRDFEKNNIQDIEYKAHMINSNMF